MIIVISLGNVTSADALNDAQQLVVESWRLVNQSYIDPTRFNEVHWKQLRQKALEKKIENSDQAYNAIEEMLMPLGDPYTRLLRPNDYIALKSNTQGSVSGVGIQLGMRDDHMIVIAPIEGSPAAEAGLLSGTEIVEINGECVKNLGLQTAAARLRGYTGTQVILKVIPPFHNDLFDQTVNANSMEGGGNARPTKEFILERRQIDLQPVCSKLLKNNYQTLGYLRITQFSESVPEQVRTSLADLEKHGMKGLILDLRNNSGGLVSAGLEVANQFLSNGSIVETVNREGISEVIAALKEQLFSGTMITIVNRGTASAAEILAGALQDNNRSILVGGQTFGKGLIQSLISLGDNSGLAITVARYTTPAGRDIQTLGITPDYLLASPEPLIPGDEKTDYWLKTSGYLLEKLLMKMPTVETR
uniref:PDZ domain (Also known as DHR or GLGF):Tail specific protease n=1 Tax=Paulinella chromatophora TaxID=39717 RepID=B1X550_PAUCH|nr:PDZ domain (also known as DHR or GLGF):Tail specific protease [Paulinella chromatophora]ACB43069.1 PDZ domain (also known as DHR or GLGF):Tail specific protease [Paulinella chromatophora]